MSCAGNATSFEKLPKYCELFNILAMYLSANLAIAPCSRVAIFPRDGNAIISENCIAIAGEKMLKRSATISLVTFHSRIAQKLEMREFHESHYIYALVIFLPERSIPGRDGGTCLGDCVTYMPTLPEPRYLFPPFLYGSPVWSRLLQKNQFEKKMDAHFNNRSAQRTKRSLWVSSLHVKTINMAERRFVICSFK